MDDAHTEETDSVDPNIAAVDALGHKLTAIGGGKGGVGKSLTSVNLATYFALQGRRVVLIDGDLGGADLHTLLGMAPPRLSLASFLKREVETLDEILVDTPVPGLQLMAGGSDILGLANPQFGQKLKLIRHLKKLQADEVLLDLGAGTSFAVLDLFNAAPERIAVLTPDPTAIQDTYAFLKTALHRRIKRELAPRNAPDAALRDAIVEAVEGPSGRRVATIEQLRTRVSTVSEESLGRLDAILADYRPWIVLNMATPSEGRATADSLGRVARDFISMELRHAGTVERDPDMARSVRQMRPHLLDTRDGPRWRDFSGIAANIVAGRAGRLPSQRVVATTVVDPPPLPKDALS
jgi:flagellar biosynthesis protein FlhG